MQCRFYIKRKGRQCSHMVVSAEEEYCSLHQVEALKESRRADYIARCTSESRAVLWELIDTIERRQLLNSESSDKISSKPDSVSFKRKRVRNKRISAPGRMANPFSMKLSPELPAIDWGVIYSDPQQPLHIDVGCARGRFILNLSKRPTRLSWNHLGIEIRPDLVASTMKELHRERSESASFSKNIHFLALNFSISAEALLSSLPPDTLRLISFQFPDPWTTKKYLRRRIIQRELIDIIVKVLSDRGFIYASSDCYHLAKHMKAVLTANPQLRLIEEGSLVAMETEWTWAGLSHKSSHCSYSYPSHPETASDTTDYDEGIVDDGRGWLSFNPLGEPSERELVCEKAWKPVWRCVVQKKCAL